jgi:hypothetical protein
MTLVDVCGNCGTKYGEDDDIARIVKSIFIPKWGKALWYELGDGEAPDEGADDAVGSEGDAEAEVEATGDGAED